MPKTEDVVAIIESNKELQTACDELVASIPVFQVKDACTLRDLFCNVLDSDIKKLFARCLQAAVDGLKTNNTDEAYVYCSDIYDAFCYHLRMELNSDTYLRCAMWSVIFENIHAHSRDDSEFINAVLALHKNIGHTDKEESL